MNIHNLNSVAKFTFKTNIKKTSYWIWFTLPISTSIFLFTMLLLNKNAINSYNSKLSLLTIMISLILFIAMFFSPIVSNELIDDRSSKINEYLFSISNSRNIIFGKILGIINLIFFTLLTYFCLLLIVIFNENEIKITFSKIYTYIGTITLIQLFILMILGIIWIILFASFISIFVKNKKKILYSLLPIYLFIGISAFITLHFYAKSLIIISMFLPILSQLFSSKLLLLDNYNIYLLISEIIIQFLEIYIFARFFNKEHKKYLFK
ncbi:ABC transporter permease family protein [Apilactobacillus timberlakei]|uniref:ABC transporter permease n=1 Tax=Apilactobacillus timberlakei TaxID=2008380 RepID=A0ABY2YUY1_9LACO|nr:hypothetical protein [Apilactobacillus timberlakei]TPR14744.1 hypothetical protein DYZ97_01010 [Apilactobacillus timberlakei]TPR15711.1 hypothetical protein DY052_03795 [Apilactobacillus timberlakei]TPR16072.1 hypothetical protein DY048_01010 [Apilactobacillus timberlakei]